MRASTWGLYCLVWGLGALYSGCINCSERIEETSGWIEVGALEACPAVTDDLYLSYSGDEILSIDGGGTKRVLQQASQKCCYDGDFTFKGSSATTLCLYVENAEVPDDGDVALCPSVNSSNVGNYYWYDGQTLGSTRDVSVGSVSAPRLESASARTWQCVYPITVRRTSDVCG